jgi:hypothetical protein
MKVVYVQLHVKCHFYTKNKIHRETTFTVIKIQGLVFFMAIGVLEINK